MLYFKTILTFFMHNTQKRIEFFCFKKGSLLRQKNTDGLAFPDILEFKKIGIRLFIW